jgi:hypothetical protein
VGSRLASIVPGGKEVATKDAFPVVKPTMEQTICCVEGPNTEQRIE